MSQVFPLHYAMNRPWLQLVLFLAITVSAGVGLCRLISAPPGYWLKRDDRCDPSALIQRLAQTRPEWILLGNSMLDSRLQAAPLSHTSGERVQIVYVPGSRSAVWYFLLKQVVLPSGARPQALTVFFRQTELTWPDFCIQGVQAEALEALDAQTQPEWRTVIEQAPGADWLVTKSRQVEESLFPNRYLNEIARQGMQARSFRSTRIGEKLTGTERRAELNERFSASHVRRTVGGDLSTADEASAGREDTNERDYTLGPQTFDPSPNASFLPHMVELAQKEGIRLHFHRVKRRPTPSGTRRDPAAIAQYMTELRTWLEARGCLLTDESADPTLLESHYADGDHLSADPAIQAQYRAGFWARVQAARAALPAEIPVAR
jgi:hypothetical protein